MDYEFKLKQELRNLELEANNKKPKSSYIFRFDEIKPFDKKLPSSSIAKVKLDSLEYRNPYEGIKKFVEEDENLTKKLKRGSHLNMNIPKWIEFKDYIGEENEDNYEDNVNTHERSTNGVSFKSSLY